MVLRSTINFIEILNTSIRLYITRPRHKADIAIGLYNKVERNVNMFAGRMLVRYLGQRGSR
jgi:hypothetical protein